MYKLENEDRLLLGKFGINIILNVKTELFTCVPGFIFEIPKK